MGYEGRNRSPPRPTLQQLQPQKQLRDASVGHIETLLGQTQDHLVSHIVGHGAKLQEHGDKLQDILQQQRLLLETLQRQQLHTTSALQLAHVNPRCMASPRSYNATEAFSEDAASKASTMPPDGKPKLEACMDDGPCTPITEVQDFSPDVFCPALPAEKREQPVMGHSSSVLGGRRTAHDVHIEAEMEKKGGVSTCVQHRYFDHVVGAAILFNALILVLQADFSVRHPGRSDHAFFDVTEILFFILFAAELALRLYVFRLDFFTQKDYKWNWFDATIVLTAFVELMIKFTVSNAIPLNVTWLRLLRIIKISRLIRMIRVVRIFRELRIMVMSIVSTLRTLLWSLVCVLLIMSGIGSYFAWAVADYLALGGETDDSEMVRHFGSMPRIMISLFQAITGGCDWRDLSDMLCRVSTTSCAVFYAYISMMVFAILNILTGICVNNADKAAEDDLNECTEMLLHDATVVRLREMLGVSKKSDSSSLELDGEGMLTWDQLKVHLGDTQVRAYFKKIGLEPWHLRSFFQLLKVGDEEPEVGIDQFIRGCMRLRCNVKNIDLMAALQEKQNYETRRCAELKKSMREVFVMLSEFRHKEDLRKAAQAHFIL